MLPTIDEARRCYQEDRLDETLRLCAALIEADIDAAEAHHLRAAVALKQGQLDEALRRLEVGLCREPSGSMCNTLAAIHLARGDGAAAREALERARVLKKVDDPRLWPNMGRALLLEGRPDEAAQWLERAVEAKPEWPEAWFVKGMVEGARGHHRVSARAFEWAASRRPGWVDALVQAAAAWRAAGDPARGRALLQAELDEVAAAQVARASRVIATLEGALITDLDLEDVLTTWRRHALRQVSEGRDLDQDARRFATAMAVHGWRAGYAWRESSAETDQLSRLGSESRAQMLVRACYRRPESGEGLPDAVAVLVGRAAAIRARIAALPVIHFPEGETARAVAAQYEAHPYPLWETLPAPLGVTTPEEAASRVSAPGVCIEPCRRAPDEPLRILVAGCGTGRHAIDVARRYRPAEVTAVDISRASLAYAQCKASELGVDARFAVADIALLRPADFAERFHHVESIGVLHHTADPLEAWRRLRALLAPGATMKIGLYSRTFRALLGAARQHVGAADAGTDAGLRAARTRLLGTCSPRDLAPLLALSDLYSTAGLRDLLFHPCEHAYDLDEVAKMLAALRLRFVGFDDLPPATVEAFNRRHGEASRASVEAWQSFERMHPQTFRCMYVFWCQAED